MPEPPPLIRSYLYAPGSNPAVMEKAVRAGADAVIFDLEDSVAVSDKSAARDEVAAMIARVSGDAGSLEVLVRVNRGPDGVSGDDVAAVVRPGLTGLRVPKVGSAAELDALAGLLDDLEARAGMPPGAVRIYPVIETAAAVLCVGELAAAPRVARLGFGATDFLADIGAPGAGDGPGTLVARSSIVLASRAAGIGAPVDSVYTRIDDSDGLIRSARSARELGFFGKSVIHPRQIAPVHEVFTPSEEELSVARKVVEQAGRVEGASALGGEMIDPAVVARARRVLDLSRERLT